jgi:gas vesicle protein
VDLAKQETSTLLQLLESQSTSIQDSVQQLEKALETIESQPLSELVQDIEQLKTNIPMVT